MMAPEPSPGPLTDRRVSEVHRRIGKPLADARGSDQRWYEKAGLLDGSVTLPICALDGVQKETGYEKE